MPNELTTTAPLPVAESPAVTVGAMLQAAISGGLGVDGIKALAEIYERQVAKNAEQQFSAAFAALQADLPKLKPSGVVKEKNSEAVRYRFAEFDAILDTVKPFMQKHGFGASFDTERGNGVMTAKCTLMHIGGHSRTNSFTCRIGGGPPGTNEAQQDGSARSYAKRYALCDALNLNIDRDNDGAAAMASAETITAEQAADLRTMLIDTGMMDRFRAKYGDNVEALSVKDYGSVLAAVRKKQGGA